MALRAVSVLTWIACAVAPPHGRAEASHPVLSQYTMGEKGRKSRRLGAVIMEVWRPRTGHSLRG
jgi:hypothetical protein